MRTNTHSPAGDWTCSCGYDYFGGSTAYSNQLLASHLAYADKRRFAGLRDSFSHPGVAYVLVALVALLLVVALSSCGTSATSYESDCLAEGGEVVEVGARASCVVDGAVVAEWVR